jgi:hypothetical protein
VQDDGPLRNGSLDAAFLLTELPVDLCADVRWRPAGTCGPVGLHCASNVCANGGSCRLDSQTLAAECDCALGWHTALCTVPVGAWVGDIAVATTGDERPVETLSGPVAVGAATEIGLQALRNSTLVFQAALAGAVAAAVRYGPPDSPDAFACEWVASPSALSPPVASPDILTALAPEELRCTLAGGYGGSVAVALVLTDSRGRQLRRVAPTALAFPPPRFTAGTLRRDGGLPQLDGQGASRITAQGLLGDTIAFDGADIPPAAALRVWAGTQTDPRQVPCLPQAGRVRASGVVCDLQAGEGQGLSLLMEVGGVASLRSADTLDYPDPPKVYAVSGCQPAPGESAATAQCPTQGGLTLTVVGASLAEPLQITVDGRECALPTPVPGAQPGSAVTCRLPEGAGARKAVVAVRGSVMSAPALLLSYRLPVLDSVTVLSGCEQSGPTAVTECRRTGGAQLVIDGDQFGPGAPRIVIGGAPCRSVVALVPHRRALCTAPAGTLPGRSVMLVQAGGRFSDGGAAPLLVSYSQCRPGTFESGLACPNCSAGRYTGGLGLSQCVACAPGSFARAGEGACTLCPPGRVQSRSEQGGCDVCPGGSFSDASGGVTCAPCFGGTAAAAGSGTCAACSPGFFSQDLAANCTACGRGTFASGQRSRECVRAPPGTFAGDNATVRASNCRPGTFQPSEAAEACEACDRGRFSDAFGMQLCEVCAEGRYADDRGLDVCRACPSDGVECFRDRLDVSDGFWVLETRTEGVSFRCHNAGACQAGSCASNRPDAPANVLCGECDEGHSEWGGSCVDCTGGWRVLNVVLFLLQGYLPIAVLYCKLAARRARRQVPVASLSLLVVSLLVALLHSVLSLMPRRCTAACSRYHTASLSQTPGARVQSPRRRPG